MKIIGIDPSFRDNGFSIATIENNELTTYTFKKYLDFIEWAFIQDFSTTIIYIENSNLQNVSFKVSNNKSVALKMARNVGMNQAASQLASDLLQSKGAEVINISPNKKGSKIKDNLIICNLLTRFNIQYKKTSFNQDERDAIKLLLNTYLNK